MRVMRTIFNERFTRSGNSGRFATTRMTLASPGGESRRAQQATADIELPIERAS